MYRLGQHEWKRLKKRRSNVDWMPANQILSVATMLPVPTLTYSQRAARHKNPAAKLLLETIERKRSNLAVSVDVTKSDDFLAIIDAVGPLVCLVKVNQT